MTTEPQRGGVGERVLVPREPTEAMIDAMAEVTAEGFGNSHEEQAAEVYRVMIAASPVKVESGEAVSDELYKLASTAVCESRNRWSILHEENWLEDDGGPHPDDYIGRAVVNAILAALSTRRPDDRVNSGATSEASSGTDSGKVGGGVG